MGLGLRWARLRSAIGFGVHQQVTVTGALFTALILLVAMAAFASANNLLFLLLAALLSTLLISGFISRLSLAGLQVDFILQEHVTARRKIAGHILVRNTKAWMPSFSIRLTGSPDSGLTAPIYFPVIPGSGILEEMVEVYFARRGPHRENSLQFSTRFPFDFTERRVQVALAREVLVYPAIDPQPGFEDLLVALSGELEAHYRGRGHDFYRIRPYEVLESARHVDWKATAHTGELQVREFAREQEHLIEVFLDLNVPEEKAEWFESAISCCAFLAWQVAARAARIRFRTQEFDMRLPEDGDVYAILRYLALVQPMRGGEAISPADESGYHIVLSLAPERAAEAGWRHARILGPEAFPAVPVRAGERG